MTEEKRKTTASHRKAVAKYHKANYSNIAYAVRKEKKTQLQDYATAKGLSLNRLIDIAVTDYIARNPLEGLDSGIYASLDRDSKIIKV